MRNSTAEELKLQPSLQGSAVGGLLAGWGWWRWRWGWGLLLLVPGEGEAQETENARARGSLCQDKVLGYESGWGPEGWLGALAVAA
jgi:hypothetical protein